jgi:hypothetical protein
MIAALSSENYNHHFPDEQECEENENTKFFWPQSQNVTDVSRGKRLGNGYGGA